MTYFSRDRIHSLVFALTTIPIILFSPWSWLLTGLQILMWAGCAFFVFANVVGTSILLERSERTTAYVVSIAANYRRKKGGIIGDLLDHLPPASVAAAWIWTGFLYLGGSIGLLWIGATINVSLALNLWSEIDADTQSELLDVWKENFK